MSIRDKLAAMPKMPEPPPPNHGIDDAVLYYAKEVLALAARLADQCRLREECERENDALRERLAEAERDAGRWQPIETAPKDGTEFQVWMHNASLPTGWWEPRCRFNDDGAFEVWQRIDYDDLGWDTVSATPTHWMPQPTSPAAIDAAMERK